VLHLIDDGLAVVAKFLAESAVVDLHSDELFGVVDDCAFAEW
jgi:nitrite reductase/ring-hydroxylating ferredoxin subunit